MELRDPRRFGKRRSRSCGLRVQRVLCVSDACGACNGQDALACPLTRVRIADSEKVCATHGDGVEPKALPGRHRAVKNHVGSTGQHDMSTVEPQPVVAKPNLRWFQFSLRTLLVFVTLCAIACSWVAVKRQQEKQQREALARIEELVGSLSDPQDDKPSQQFSTSPFWDCDAFGFRYLGSLYLTGTRTTDSTLRQLKGLPELTRLHLDFTKVTDVGLENLKGLTQLAYLDLADTQITDAGLQHLGGLTQLKTLDLRRTRVTDAGLEHLTGLTQLRNLELYKTSVTHAGVAKLQQALPNCEIHK